jgi:hypothetical protein
MARATARCLVVLLMLVAAGSSAFGQQPAICPWLNAATAAGILGEEVNVTVAHSAAGHQEQMNGAPADMTCDFKPSHGTATLSLQIAVHTMEDHKHDLATYQAMCDGSSRPLKGVGNEAIACEFKGKSNERVEWVIGRVRERVFIASLVTPGSSAQSPATIRDKIQNLAEQLAGSLF